MLADHVQNQGYMKVLQAERGKLSYRAVVKQELEAKKGMSGEESMVLSHIQAAGNQGTSNQHCGVGGCVELGIGLWTKHLKAKTELHQTVIDRCLKSLLQKQLIKPHKDVRVRINTPAYSIMSLSYFDALPSLLCL
jgi:DNA-directed RNA polymerase III subunit RPC6